MSFHSSHNFQIEITTNSKVSQDSYIHCRHFRFTFNGRRRDLFRSQNLFRMRKGLFWNRIRYFRFFQKSKPEEWKVPLRSHSLVKTQVFSAFALICSFYICPRPWKWLDIYSKLTSRLCFSLGQCQTVADIQVINGRQPMLVTSSVDTNPTAGRNNWLLTANICFLWLHKKIN